MNETLNMLLGGDLKSDGRAIEIADRAIEDPHTFGQLVEGLFTPDDLIRGRTAHALERISRTRPEMVLGMLPHIVQMAITDRVPMVRWHMAMLFANLPLAVEQETRVISTLLEMLDDPSVFVKSWAIVSLTTLGRGNVSVRKIIAAKIRRMQNDPSIAIRSKVSKALRCLEDESEPIPVGWVKSK